MAHTSPRSGEDTDCIIVFNYAVPAEGVHQKLWVEQGEPRTCWWEWRYLFQELELKSYRTASKHLKRNKNTIQAMAQSWGTPFKDALRVSKRARRAQGMPETQGLQEFACSTVIFLGMILHHLRVLSKTRHQDAEKRLLLGRRLRHYLTCAVGAATKEGPVVWPLVARPLVDGQQSMILHPDGTIALLDVGIMRLMKKYPCPDSPDTPTQLVHLIFALSCEHNYNPSCPAVSALPVLLKHLAPMVEAAVLSAAPCDLLPVLRGRRAARRVDPCTRLHVVSQPNVAPMAVLRHGSTDASKKVSETAAVAWQRRVVAEYVRAGRSRFSGVTRVGVSHDAACYNGEDTLVGTCHSYQVKSAMYLQFQVLLKQLASMCTAIYHHSRAQQSSASIRNGIRHP